MERNTKIDGSTLGRRSSPRKQKNHIVIIRRSVSRLRPRRTTHSGDESLQRVAEIRPELTARDAASLDDRAASPFRATGDSGLRDNSGRLRPKA
ncbi:MAG: hypothetical protein GY847_19915 [Proteobacteria bacterium]|nr:hypothetical protein [Pseudomonadota bacterium]